MKAEMGLNCEFLWFQLEVAFVWMLLCSSFNLFAMWMQEMEGEWREGGEVRGDEVCWVFVGVMPGAQCPLCVWAWRAGDVMAGRARSPLSLWRHDMAGTKKSVAGIVGLNQAVTGGNSPSSAATETQPANHSLLWGKWTHISSLKWSFL